MQNIFKYPEFLENRCINDADIAKAYDTLSSPKRAHLKSGIAFNHFLYKEKVHEHQCIVKDNSKGYMFSLKTKPVAYTILFFDHTYSSAPRIIAALMPAILAKVPLILAISINGLPSNNVLTSLELMGIEDIFSLPNDVHKGPNNEALEIIKSLQESRQNGRVLFMHNNTLSSLVQYALEHDLIFWQENKSPRIAVQENTVTNEYLDWAHPDAICSEFNAITENNINNIDTLFCTQDFYMHNKNALCDIELILFEGMEGCWAHSNLRPEFFQKRTMLMGKSDP